MALALTMATLSPSTLSRLEDMLRPPRRRGHLGRGRRSQEIRGQDIDLTTGARSARALQTFSRISKKVPEVVVRKTGKQSSGGHVLANFAYISRLGYGGDREIELTTNEGRTITNGVQMKQLADEWGYWHLDDKVRRKGAVSYSLVFSMPAETDAEAVKEATISVAQRECPDQGWVVALHTDTDHLHAHLTVQAKDQFGDRQYFPTARLALMREMFAEELRDRGIEANATSRRARGVYDKPTPIQAIKEQEKKGASQREANLKEKLKAEWAKDPSQDQIDQRMRRAKTGVVEVYKDVARELLLSADPGDKQLGMAIVKHLENMPAPQNRYSVARETVQQTVEAQKDRSADRGPIQDTERDR